MKKTILIAVILLSYPFVSIAYTSPGSPSGFVNDFAGVLSVQESQQLESKLVSLRENTGAEVAVVTIGTIGNDETIESYSVKLFEEWGIGNKDKDTGLLLLIVTEDRQMRIEVGYGLEGAVTDIQSGNIIRKVLTPAFQEGNYALGISGAVDALSAIITDSPEAEQYSVVESSGQSSSDTGWGGVFFVIIILINLLSRWLGKTKSWWLGGVIGAFAGTIIAFIIGSFAIGIGITLALTVFGLIFDFIVSKHPPSGGHGGFWPIFFGGGRGRHGGGFGGFGGGMSGGGGASGRW